MTGASKLKFFNPAAITPLTCLSLLQLLSQLFFIYCNYFSNKICFLVILYVTVQSNKKIIVKKSYVPYLSPWLLLGHGEVWRAGWGAVNREESVSWGIRCTGAYLQKESQTMKE